VEYKYEKQALDYDNTVARGKINGMSFMCNGRVMQIIVLALLFKHDLILKITNCFFTVSKGSIVTLC